jgi:dihydroorotate dehydrogenase (fumarate)
VNIETHYLGLHLRSPIVSSACPLTERLENVKRLEDAGAGAIVFHSLFEEQLHPGRREIISGVEPGIANMTEPITFTLPPQNFSADPEQYLEQLRRAKASVQVPIIASLNAHTEGGWIEFAKLIRQTGVDALELNLYSVPGDPNQNGAEIETNYLRIIAAVKAAVQIPVAVKLSPFFTSFSNVARKFVTQGGANALVLFNRFYQPDFNAENFETVSNVLLSTPVEMRLPLRWIAMLYGKIQADFAATGGVHYAIDIVKLLMAGASVTMVCSALLNRGISYLTTLERSLSTWLEVHGYDSVRQIQGRMSQLNCPDPSAFERAQYIRAIGSLPSMGWRKL